MRLSEINKPLNEKINNGSRRLGIFLTTNIKILNQIITEVEKSKDVIKQNENDCDYVLSYALGQIENAGRVHPPNIYEIDLVKHYHLEDLKHNFESILIHGTNNFSRFVDSTIEYMSPLDERTKKILTMMPHIGQGLAEYGFEPNSDDPEYLAAIKCGNAYVSILKALNLIENMIVKTKTVFADLRKRQEFQFNPHKYRPDHEEIETLYHASLYASDIVKNGFAVEKPVERAGLGNLGSQDTISFTHDIKIAHDIMRALKEIWMIVNGKLRRSEIMKWITAENLDHTAMKRLYGDSKADPNSLEQVIKLYTTYLGFSKLRTDPVFISPAKLIPLMQERDINDIGIVSCDVKLNQGEEYLHGEAEFRVPASAVVGHIKRVG